MVFSLTPMNNEPGVSAVSSFLHLDYALAAPRENDGASNRTAQNGSAHDATARGKHM